MVPIDHKLVSPIMEVSILEIVKLDDEFSILGILSLINVNYLMSKSNLFYCTTDCKKVKRDF